MQNRKYEHEENMIVYKKHSQFLAIAQTNPVLAQRMIQVGYIQGNEGSGSATRGLLEEPTRVYEEE